MKSIFKINYRSLSLLSLLLTILECGKNFEVLFSTEEHYEFLRPFYWQDTIMTIGIGVLLVFYFFKLRYMHKSTLTSPILAFFIVAKAITDVFTGLFANRALFAFCIFTYILAYFFMILLSLIRLSSKFSLCLGTICCMIAEIIFVILFGFIGNVGINSLVFYTTLLLYILKEPIPEIPFSFIKRKMTPAQELEYLSERLELGEISEEEYKQKRTEIINNL